MTEPKFPAAMRTGRIRRWKLSDLIAYERACAELPPLSPADPRQEIYLTAAQVRQRLGVSDMWIWRRCHAEAA